MEQFQEFSATELYCPTCKQSMPVQQNLLLLLADGDLYGYRCKRCGLYLGTRKTTKANPFKI